MAEADNAVYARGARKVPPATHQRCVAFLEYVRQHPPQMVYDRHKEQVGRDELDPPKCNERAAKLRQEGNELYGKKDYMEALSKYNESIRWACGGSEDLGIGFANRSAVFYDLQEYEFALENIRLARQNNYPARLLSKLEARELNCSNRMKIEAIERRYVLQAVKVGMKVEMNSSIPCLAKGVGTGKFPRYGRGMKAEQDFKVGDVILRESSAVVAIDVLQKFQACHHCASHNNCSLIPCPRCVSVMYCNEECLTIGWKEFHRFECGIKNRLSIVPFGTYSVGPTLLFYGLTQFNDSVVDMMNYCEENDRNGNDPLSLDYTNPMNIFKRFHTAKVKPLSSYVKTIIRFITAIIYDIYLEHPLVRSLFVGENKQNFLLQAMHDCMTVAARMTIGVTDRYVIELYSVASLCNHSCDPNAHAVHSSGQIKIIAVRPINKGEQICIPYGFVNGEGSEYDRFMRMATLDFCCVCQVCAPNSEQVKPNNDQPHRSFHRDLRVLNETIENESCIPSDRITALQHFIQRYAYGHPSDEYAEILLKYRTLLQKMFEVEVVSEMMKKLN
nr:SET and MYND domain-containing protein 4-like [Aedes albopictus]